MSGDPAKPPSPSFDMRALVDSAPGATERVRQLQCLATIGQVAVGVGHELRNYLIPITAHAQLASELTDNEEALEHLAGIQRAVQRCRALIDQVLAAGREVSVQKRPLYISTIVQDTLPLLRAAVPRAIDLKISVGERIPLVDTDVASIEQLVLNLVLNAAKAIPAGYGCIEIGVEARESGRVERAAKTFAGGASAGVRLTVRDNGIGMEPALTGRIFEPGFTSWGDREGTGLGLSIVREIVKRHHGEIHVESAPGAGAAFHIDLPISGTAPSTPAKK
jgi:two-component system, cell cycle sensor histidine kinase and response regulator CckA